MQNFLPSIRYYLNPFRRLGNKNYSIRYALIANLLLCVLSEYYAYHITHDPLIVGNYIIIPNALFILYFAFRDGVAGGLVSTGISVTYYLYIIQTRMYQGQQLTSGISTTIMLFSLYTVLSLLVGFLKQTLDDMILKEKNQRRRLEQILQQLPVGIVITNEKGVIEETNTQLDNILGLHLEPGLVAGEDVTVKGKRQDNSPIIAENSPIAQALFKGIPILNQQFEIEKPNKEKVFIQVNASPIKGAEGKTTAAVSIITDITKDHEIEKHKDDFINMASHELKTPLTSALILAQVLQKRWKSKKSEDREFVDKISLQLEKISGLVREILDVAKINEGKLALNKENFLVKDLAEEIVEEMQHISSHNIRLDWHTHHLVFADKDRIRQVLVNLVSNAIKYSPKGKDVIISSKKEDNKIIVAVTDFGVGIAKKKQEKIFERFYQVGEYRSSSGVGLGLFISNEIIRAHEGEMGVESETNKGSTFYFSLPIEEEKLS